MTEEKKRTNRQSRALHKYFELLANDLNDAGYDLKRTLRNDVEIPWTPVLVKELIFRKVMIAMYDKQSTTKLTTKELISVSDTIARHLSSKLGIGTDFPSINNILNQS